MRHWMRDFIGRHEVGSAILLIAVYCFGSANVPGGSDSYWCILFLGCCALVITLGVCLSGNAGRYGLSSWPVHSRKFLYFIPLWIITSSNLWGGVAFSEHGIALAGTVVSMLFVGYIEEMLFRGLLFSALLKSEGVVTAVTVSSVTFGIGHIVNLFTGMDTLMTLIQVVYAVAMGFMFTMVFYRSRSLWPCIISHQLIDIFSYFINYGMVLSWIVTGVVFSGCIVYGVYLAKLPDEVTQQSEMVL